MLVGDSTHHLTHAACGDVTKYSHYLLHLLKFLSIFSLFKSKGEIRLL